MEGWDFEIQIDGMSKQRFASVRDLVEDENPPSFYIPNIPLTTDAKTFEEWHRAMPPIIGQCEWCGKHATGDPNSTPFLCEDCATNPDRPPFILCSHCGERLTEIIGVSRKWFRCTPCGRELGR